MKLPIDTGSVKFAAAGPFQRPDRLLEKILKGELANVDFNDLNRLTSALGIREVRGRGSHRLFVREGSQSWSMCNQKLETQRYIRCDRLQI